LLAHYLRERGVKQPIGFFFHTPFASRASIECLPRHAQLFDKLLAYDLVGFQTQEDLDAFHDYAVASLGAKPQQGSALEFAGRSIRLAVFPVGIDVDDYARMADAGDTNSSIATLRRALSDINTVIGVDRLDYSKGLPQRF